MEININFEGFPNSCASRALVTCEVTRDRSEPGKTSLFVN